MLSFLSSKPIRGGIAIDDDMLMGLSISNAEQVSHAMDDDLCCSNENLCIINSTICIGKAMKVKKERSEMVICRG